MNPGQPNPKALLPLGLRGLTGIPCPHFAHIIPGNRGNTRETVGIRKAAQPYSRKAKRLVSAEADWWRRGELNPGPMTEPTVFYVRSLLAKLAIFLPPSMSQTTDGEHIRS